MSQFIPQASWAAPLVPRTAPKRDTVVPSRERWTGHRLHSGDSSATGGSGLEVDFGHAPALVSGPGPHGGRSRLQPMDGAARGTLRSFVYRAGVRLQR